MSQLSTIQLLYLLYAQAYSDEGSVTKGVVKSYLPKEGKKEAEQTYEYLIERKFIESHKKHRLSVTALGKKILNSNMGTTNYRFDTVKGQKVINTLLMLFQEIYCDLADSKQNIEEMSFDTFVEKFKQLYFTERKLQELRGVVAIHSREICRKFKDNYPISQSLIDNYFNKLKSTGKVFAVIEQNEELIQWVE